MKIASAGLDLPAGKFKYEDRIFTDLAAKFKPKKLVPYTFEFVGADFASADAAAASANGILDLLILDMEKIESRLSRVQDPAEKRALEKCMAELENQKPVCDMRMEEAELGFVRTLSPLSMKPTAVLPDGSDPNAVCKAVLGKADSMFFYTVGPDEVRAWLVRKNADAVTCAGKIHSDLARGFIKAELVSYADIMKVHGMQEARTKGLVKLVDRDFPVPDETIIEIRFNV